MHINDILKVATERKASDVHLKVGAHPLVRVDGTLVPLVEFKRLMQEDTIAMAFSMMSSQQKEKFKQFLEIDIAYSVPGLGRFRCNIFQQRSSVGLVLRLIPARILTIRELLLPPVLEKIGEEERGLVLVTGTTGSGKSTTLAAMIDHVNSRRNSHIVTIEDPIEFLHRDKKSIINQREVEVDTRNFAVAMRAALRQDPDVILVGEMRDFETIETALLAAETGHLVLSTLHTLEADPHPTVGGPQGDRLAAPAATRRRPWARAGGRGPDLDSVHSRLHRAEGEDQADPRRDLTGHVAVRHADLRPVIVPALQAGACHPRRGSPQRNQQGRVQAPPARHPVDRRHLARGNGRDVGVLDRAVSVLDRQPIRVRWPGGEWLLGRGPGAGVRKPASARPGEHCGETDAEHWR
jgi:energy-coupling factor transporter ATP-binding protein EcfA2